MKCATLGPPYNRVIRAMANRLTIFGAKCRQYRSSRDLVMADQAKALGYSVAYISAIERGTRPVPKGYVNSLTAWLALSGQESDQLHTLASAEADVIKFVPADRERAVIAAELANRFNDLPIERLRKIRELSASGEIRRYSQNDIRELAQLVRDYLNLANRLTFDLLEILENKLADIDSEYALCVTSGGSSATAHTEIVEGIIRNIAMSEDAYESVRKTPEGRYVAAHELGHWLLHPKARPFLANPKLRRATKDSRLEHEADLFARELLMPPFVLGYAKSAGQLAMICNVPLSVASRRIEELGEPERRASERASLNRKFDELLAHLRDSRGPDKNRPQSSIASHGARNKPAGPADKIRLPLFEYADRQTLECLGPDRPNRKLQSAPSSRTKISTSDRSAIWYKAYGWRG